MTLAMVVVMVMMVVIVVVVMVVLVVMVMMVAVMLTPLTHQTNGSKCGADSASSTLSVITSYHPPHGNYKKIHRQISTGSSISMHGRYQKSLYQWNKNKTYMKSVQLGKT